MTRLQDFMNMLNDDDLTDCSYIELRYNEMTIKCNCDVGIANQLD